ncbi:PucR family transcriptional regulator [Streptosporangium roseum]|uniref:PucR family transcriptional regulator n=1 Tax=Streptosporangium roseum TaxID=2001 RepID=UPI0001A3ED08|nr:helix-turn-helix domain-containing protein [Streptosporangium roseum]
MLILAGCPVHELLERQATSLARQLVHVFVEEIPIYRRLPREELDGDITRITEHNLRMICEMFRHGRPPSSAELAPLRDSAARRAQERVPLEALLAAYHLGTRWVWDRLITTATPADFAAVVDMNRLVLLYSEVVTSAVCTAYLSEREGMLSQEQHAMHAAVSALLGGDHTALAAVRLAPGYLVMAIAVGAHPDEKQDEPGGSIAARRKLARIRAAVQRYASEQVLFVLDATGGLVLLPCSGEVPIVTEVVEAMSGAAGVPIWAATEQATPAEVSAAAGVAEEVLEVARIFGRPPGAYLLADVLLEYQLTRPSRATARLAGLLDPLLDNPDLLRTLKAYLETGLDRRRTAELLHVHPNTVDYRLRRAVSLTGLDPADPAQLQQIGAALAARRLTPR